MSRKLTVTLSKRRKMYLHCKNIFIGEQTLQTGQPLPEQNVRSQSYPEETREGGGVEGLMEILIQSD